jgi:hypothetical protein
VIFERRETVLRHGQIDEPRRQEDTEEKKKTDRKKWSHRWTQMNTDIRVNRCSSVAPYSPSSP